MKEHPIQRIEIKPGLQFISTEFKGLITALNVDGNKLEVRIQPPAGTSWREEWNLQHTRWGFENGSYKLLVPNR